MKRDYIKMPMDILRDPRYGTLTDDLWRLMMQLFLLAGEAGSDGMLPAPRDMAWELRIGSGTLQIALHHLAECGLVQSTPQGWLVTDFQKFQAAPTSTERTRVYRKHQRSATQNEPEFSQDPEQDQAAVAGQDLEQMAAPRRTFGATEMQPFRHIPVSKPVTSPVPSPVRLDPAARGRRRHKPKGPPVDSCPVEKGRKFSDPCPPISTSNILTRSLKTYLTIKPLLVVDQEDLEIEPHEIQPPQGEDPEILPVSLGIVPLTGEKWLPPGKDEPGAGQNRVAWADPWENDLPRPVEKSVDKPVDKPVDNRVVDRTLQEMSRKFSDLEDGPP